MAQLPLREPDEDLPEPPFPGKPPFELVQLSDIPIALWRGRPVFHPMSQQGETAHWKAEDCLFFQSSDEMLDGELLPADKPGTAYDVGVVVKWETENYRNEPHNPAAHEVWFLTGNGYALHYPANNLWTPRLPHELELLAALAPGEEP